MRCFKCEHEAKRTEWKPMPGFDQNLEQYVCENPLCEVKEFYRYRRKRCPTPKEQYAK